MTRTCFRFFSITGYEKEEKWIHDMFLQGWKLTGVRFQCIYTFEKCEPADMSVRLEYSDDPLKSRPDYEMMLNDYGWECLGSCSGWNYFAKPTEKEADSNELFTDDASRLSMIRRIFQRRYLFLALVLIFLIIPQIVTSVIGGRTDTAAASWIILAGLYAFAMIYCGVGFRKLLSKYSLKMNMTPALRAAAVCALLAIADIVLLIISGTVGGAFRDFWSAASPWVLAGIGLLALLFCMTGGEISEDQDMH
ncbi:MAG: DUF2812 domain-containing protein [Lachnospiraceae bacterium]|jgi:hypothetical protein